MWERCLDGTVLISGAGGTVVESLARPDLFITDAGRANVMIGSRRKDHDAALIGIQVFLDSPILLSNIIPDTINTFLSSRYPLLLPCDASTRVLEFAFIARPALVFCTSHVSNMPSLVHRSRNAHFRAKYDGLVRCHSGQIGCRRGNLIFSRHLEFSHKCSRRHTRRKTRN
jgi:hypothetical protein